MVDQDSVWMRAALAEAEAAFSDGEVPVGAVIVADSVVIGRGRNATERTQDPTGHAEIQAIRQAAEHIGSWRLEGCALYVTLEPCAMCAGALVLSRIQRLVYGADDPKAGACGSVRNIVQDPRLNHRIDVARGVLRKPCGDLLRSFFRGLRGKS